jgi:fructokinase
MKIVSIGELLWDVFDTGERLGGAPLHFAVQAHRLGHQVAFLSAVGYDERGRLALERMRALGLPTEFVGTANAPTGTVTVTIDPSGEPGYVIHRPAAYDAVEFQDPGFQPDWIYFGTLPSGGSARPRSDPAIDFFLPRETLL